MHMLHKRELLLLEMLTCQEKPSLWQYTSDSQPTLSELKSLCKSRPRSEAGRIPLLFLQRSSRCLHYWETILTPRKCEWYCSFPLQESWKSLKASSTVHMADLHYRFCVCCCQVEKYDVQSKQRVKP